MINKHVRMSDPYKIGVQLFLLMLSHGNHVCTHLTFLYHSVVFKLLNKNNARTRCLCYLFAEFFFSGIPPCHVLMTVLGRQGPSLRDNEPIFPLFSHGDNYCILCWM